MHLINFKELLRNLEKKKAYLFMSYYVCVAIGY